MSSEQLADGVNPLDAELAATWDVLKGYSGRDTDLGIARRFGDAAAAYSLRDIGAMNGRVVKVRRDVDGDGTDKEEDFSANQVSSGALEDWVNGKLESTLPADVATAAAAYSLRKVKASYSGNAVRIRRTAENREVDVAFDSEGKVSGNSLITNVTESPDAGDATEGITLKNFLENRQQNFSPTDIGDITGTYNQWTSLTASKTSFSATTGDVDVNGSRYTYQLPSAHTSSDAAITTYRFKGTISYTSGSGERLNVKASNGINGGSSSTPSNIVVTGAATISGGEAGFDHNASGDFDIQFTGNGTDQLRSIILIQSEMTGTSSVSITNLDVSILKSGATVHTWYDQAGVNNAVQATAANQPKIAESGALLADGIDFDGSDDYLEADGVSSIYTGTDEAHSSFVVVNSDAASTTQYILGIGSSTSGNPLRNTLFHSGGNIGWQVRDDAGTLKTDLSANPYVANQTYLLSALNSGTTIDFNTNSIINDNGTDADVGASTIDTVHIGTRANSPANYLNGSIQELVFYATDQSDNRFKIESNINNYYGLYTFQGDGYVSTWYDQSGSGNDATQTTAGQQPKIVENGGIVKNVKGFPSLKFEFIPRTELDIGLLISNINSVSAYIVTQKDDADTNVMAGFTQGVSSDNSRFYLPFYTGGTTPNLGYNDSASKISFGTTATGTCNLYSAFSGDTNIEAFKNGSSVGTTALVDQAVTATTSKIGQLSNSFYLDGVISEIFITTKKLQDDAATINSNVTSYYNL